ncbi:MAG: type II secretion system protein M [Burkholderiales bacterium]|nr:type II secretion system protein M [Burkholderiales bacterium]
MNAPAFWTARSPRERAVIGWSGAAIAAALLFAFAWLPMERARTRLAAELPQLRASLAEMRARLGHAKQRPA